jgi:hypothetical protein
MPMTENKKPRSQARSKPDFEIWFEGDFQDAYPEHRRVQSATALTELRKINPDAEARAAIMTRLEAWKVSAAWTDDAGKYVPGMGKFFKEGLYQRAPQKNDNGSRPPHSWQRETPMEIAKRLVREAEERDREKGIAGAT